MKFKILLIAFILCDLFSVAQNPLLLKQATTGSSSTPGIGQIVVTRSGYTFYNTVDDSNPFTDIWGLWITDGTSGGTKKLSLNDGKFITTEATMLTPFGDNKILFAGDNSSGYGEVWVSDGTQQGTFGLQNFVPGSDIAPVLEIASLENKAIYTAVSSDKHLRLHITTGSAYADTASIYDFGENVSQTGGFATLTHLKSAGDFVLFRYWYWGANSPHDVIWRSDGSPGGTFPLIDLGESPTGLTLTSDFLVMGNHAYFTVAEYGSEKTFLYQTDGTVNGTKAVTTLSDANAESGIHYSAVIGSDLYFDTHDGIHGRELWKTDGTAAGTAMVADINPGAGSSTPAYLTVLNNVLYFSADDGVHGNELWKYDPGAGTGPQLVKDICPGATGSNPWSFAVNNNTVVFSASSIPGSEHDLWVSDGSAENTLEIKGPEKSTGISLSPYLITSGEKNYFTGTTYDFTNGFQINKNLFVYTPPGKIWTGAVSADPGDANNWFPSGAPANTDNVLVASGAANGIGGTVFLFVNDLINNGTINVGNGLIVMYGNLFNSGIVNNIASASDPTYYPGVFALVSSNGLSNRTFGNSGTFNGQLTLSSNINLHLTTSSNIETLRVEGADSVFIGPYQLTVNRFPLLSPVVVLDSTSIYSMQVGSSPVTFPVTAYGSYTPVTITNHGASGYFNVSMKNGFFTNGTSGNAITREAVNKTWIIEPVNPDNVNADITLQWNAADELTEFERSHIYFMHYTSGAWNAGPLTAATGSGPYLITATGITSFSPFGISSSASALPVNLISFSAYRKNNMVQLNWQTASEINTSFYTVQRSNDGNNFSVIGNVNAGGNSSTIKNYSYTDAQPLQGANFYRLKMVDADGKFTYSKIVSVKTDGGNNALEIFPNPARDVLNVHVIGNDKNVLLQIIDMAGRKIMERKITLNGVATFPIDISKMPKGTYNLLLKGKSGNEERKFVKE